MNNELIVGRQATEKETEALNKAQEILDTVDLDIISTKPKPRP